MKRLTEKQFRKYMDAIPVPEGFTATYTPDERYAGSSEAPPLTFVIEKIDDIKIIFDIGGGGHTSYKDGAGLWRCFDRTGVSDSFYWMYSNGKPDADYKSCVTHALENIAKSRKFAETAITLPGLNRRVSPEGLEKLKAEMSKPNATKSFMPSGFGTGYLLMRRPRGPRYRGDMVSARAKPELEILLGISPLYIDTFDAD